MYLLKLKQEPVSESCFFTIICSTFIICNPKSQILPDPSSKSPKPQPRHFPAQFSYSRQSKRSIWSFLLLLPLFPCFPRNIGRGIYFSYGFLWFMSIRSEKHHTFPTGNISSLLILLMIIWHQCIPEYAITTTFFILIRGLERQPEDKQYNILTTIVIRREDFIKESRTWPYSTSYNEDSASVLNDRT